MDTHFAVIKIIWAVAVKERHDPAKTKRLPPQPQKVRMRNTEMTSIDFIFTYIHKHG
jgi:hypothetical protein